MNYFAVLVVCVVCYGVSGFPDDFMDDDKLVIPLKHRTKTKSIEMPRHKMNMKFHQFRKIKPQPEESSNHDSLQSKFSKVQFSSSSFSSRVVSSNGNTQETEASSKFHATSDSDGTTQLNQTESIAQAKENKSVNGCTENRESVAAVKSVEVTNKNPDGSVQTVGTAVVKSAITQTADGETKRQEVKAATMAENVKDAAGEEHSKVIGLVQAEKTKSINGQTETTKTLAAGESEQVTHGDGKSERTDKFVLLVPDSKKDKSNNDDAKNTKKENNKRDNGQGNKATQYKVDKTEAAAKNSDLDEVASDKNTNKSENIQNKNDAITQSYDKDSDRITEEVTGDDEYYEESATSDDEDETDETDSESDTDNDDNDSVKTHDTDYTNTGNENNKEDGKNDDSGVNKHRTKG